MEPGTCVQRPVWKDHALEPFDLVLEGGGMRCLFTAGVLDFFLDQGLLAQTVIGTSAGAACGYNYVSGATGRTCYMNVKYAGDWRFFSMRSKLITGSAYGARFIFDTIPNKLEGIDYTWFSQSPMRLTSVATCLETGTVDYHTYDQTADVTADAVERGSEYLMATTSIPLVSKPVAIDGKHLLDGGITDSVPFRFGRERGAKKQVVVLSQPRGFRLAPTKSMPFIRRKYRRYPNFVVAVRRRHVGYNSEYREIEHLHNEGGLYAIWPDSRIDIKLMEKDPSELLRVYEMGYAQAASEWQDIQRYLGL